MNEPGAVTNDDRELTRPVFISYATSDRKEALGVCTALERRGRQCWISTRDVAPGENYQEAIVRSLSASIDLSQLSNASIHWRVESS